jgi:hypothetical protein
MDNQKNKYVDAPAFVMSPIHIKACVELQQIFRIPSDYHTWRQRGREETSSLSEAQQCPNQKYGQRRPRVYRFSINAIASLETIVNFESNPVSGRGVTFVGTEVSCCFTCAKLSLSHNTHSLVELHSFH